MDIEDIVEQAAEQLGVKLVRSLAYMGKEGCEDVRCARSVVLEPETGRYTFGPCRGWHCSHCHQPCSSQGHAGCGVSADE
jgi:hypothetical protein